MSVSVAVSVVGGQRQLQKADWLQIQAPWIFLFPSLMPCEPSASVCRRDKRVSVSVSSVSCRKLIGSILAPSIFLLPSLVLCEPPASASRRDKQLSVSVVSVSVSVSCRKLIGSRFWLVPDH